MDPVEFNETDIAVNMEIVTGAPESTSEIDFGTVDMHDNCDETLNHQGSKSHNKNPTSINYTVFQVSDAEYGSSIQQSWQNLALCSEAMDVESSTSKILFDATVQRKSLMDTEDSLLALAASNAVECLFYVTLLQIGNGDSLRNIVRFFEFGTLNGFFYSRMFPVLEQDHEELLPYQVYTFHDVYAKRNRDSEMYLSRRKLSQRSSQQSLYLRQVKNNKTNVQASFHDIQKSFSENEVRCLKSLLFVMHKVQKFENNDSTKRIFLTSSESFIEIEKQLMDFRLNPVKICETQLNANLNNLSLAKQFEVLTSLPNFHKWCWPGENNAKIIYEQRFSHIKSRNAASPRNRLIQAWTSKKDPQLISFSILKNLHGRTCEIPYRIIRDHHRKKTAQKKRKGSQFKSFVSTVTTADDDDGCMTNDDNHAEDDDVYDVENSSDVPLYKSSYTECLYRFFCGEIFSKGTCKWRVNSTSKQVIVMNDYHCETGNFLPYTYVHVSVNRVCHRLVYHCQCKIFATSKDDGLSECCHCRLMADLISHTTFNSNYSAETISNKQFVDENIKFTKEQVLKLPSQENVKKFSVVASDDDISEVSVFSVEKTKKQIVQCHSSCCAINKSTKRSVIRLNDAADVCLHLQCFRLYFNEHLDDFNVTEENCHAEDFLPEPKWDKVFEPETGLWSFGKDAPSTQVIDANEFSTELQTNVIKRDKMKMNEKQFFSPEIPSYNCQCQAGWTFDEFPEGILIGSGKTSLYLENTVVQAEFFTRQCLSGSCALQWTGEFECIYRSSSRVCAGYEIGWEFVNLVNNGKMTFSGFVSFMNSRYQRRSFENVNFMSVQVFIDWWFGWASHMKIDFRESCTACKGQLNLLACDGTKVGIGFKNAFVEPIESSSSDVILPTSLKRLDRCFITSKSEHPPSFYKVLRSNLLRLTKVVLGKAADTVSQAELRLMRDQLSEHVPSPALPLLDRMLSNIPIDEKNAIASLFKELSRDSSVDTVIPFKAVDDLISFVRNCLSGNFSSSDVKEFVFQQQYFNREVTNAVNTSSQNSSTGLPHNDLLDLLMYLAFFVKSIHAMDVPAESPIPIHDSYNPAKYGRAFYFTQHGKQIRHMRKFSIDLQTTNSYDDNPDELCNKVFPQVSKRGMTFVFFWFCPLHGHCYGFHVIPGSEGRKDASAALYTHAETAPSVVFYDHACSLSEYVKNRESGFFQETRFFHDVSHGFTHKCTTAFKSNTILGFSGTNTSICEQFNSFIQRIKTSVKLMNQTHFMFYLQFFVFLWNRNRKLSYEKKTRIVHLGTN